MLKLFYKNCGMYEVVMDRGDFGALWVTVGSLAMRIIFVWSVISGGKFAIKNNINISKC
jgi:hypothetical protein